MVKHLILLFLFDLVEGILGANSSLASSHIDPSIIHELLELVMNMVKDVHSNKLELVENYLSFVRFSVQRNQEIVRKYHRYDKSMAYNPAAMAYFVHQLFFSDSSE